ncbi:MAG TPA: hypothetical protein VNQ90_20995 [Chthoniobacteraceae bacterium]|nr:hypothetical protein [Chthoniobacteraceae bacterium]
MTSLLPFSGRTLCLHLLVFCVLPLSLYARDPRKRPNGAPGNPGLVLTSPVDHENSGTIEGGAGGKGEDYEDEEWDEGGNGGAGGNGVEAYDGSFFNSGVLRGGAGGRGGDGFVWEGGRGGDGGAATFFNAIALTNDGEITGGRGGNGGNTQDDWDIILPGGRGGNGGVGVGSFYGSVINRATITGGVGGNAGTSEWDEQAGGDGGAGIAMREGTIINEGRIAGGRGGIGQDPEGPPVPHGTGGNGIVGYDVEVVNRGTIEGALGGDGVSRARAILFAGGVNTLRLFAGSSIIGGVSGTGQDTLILAGGAGDGNGLFDTSVLGSSFTGFLTQIKEGEGTWTLYGTATNGIGWWITDGTLVASSDGALGAGAVTVDGRDHPEATLKIVHGTTGTTTISNHIFLVEGNLVNEGAISYGTPISAPIESLSGPASSIQNHGTIRMSALPISGNRLISFLGAGELRNTGTIEVPTGAEAVAFEDRGLLVNEANASITGGVLFRNGGRLFNDGMISSPQRTVRMEGFPMEVTNTGTIKSSGRALSYGSHGTLVNDGGTIEGGTLAVQLEEGGILINHRGGKILSGGVNAIENLSGDVDLDNMGTIRGSVVLGHAGRNRVTLYQWGNITGDLLMGGNTMSELTLGGDEEHPEAPTIRSYSQAVTGATTFSGALRKEGSQVWKLDVSMSGLRETVVEEGKLIVASQLTGGRVTVESAGTLVVETSARVNADTFLVDGRLEAAGAIDGNVEINGLLVAAGEPGDDLRFERSLTLGDASTTRLTLRPGEEGGGATSVSTPSLTYGGLLSISVGSLLEIEEGEWTLFGFLSYSGNFDAVELTGSYELELHRVAGLWQGVGDGYAWSFSTGEGLLSVRAVPEASTVWLLGIGLALWAASRFSSRAAGGRDRAGRSS